MIRIAAVKRNPDMLDSFVAIQELCSDNSYMGFFKVLN